MNTRIAVVVTTYNWPQALNLVLASLTSQTIPAAEIIIADDGSSSQTKECIKSWQNKNTCTTIKHIWQKDNGFQVAAIRNKAILANNSDFIIFLDGDCVPRQDFISSYRKLLEKGHFIVGQRILLNKEFTKLALKNQLPIYSWNNKQWAALHRKGYCNRWWPLLKIPIYRYAFPKRWQGAKACNLGIWTADIKKINGWEEEFTGWGFEDSDLVIRLIRHGIARKTGRFLVPVIHLWHNENSRYNMQENYKLLQKNIDNNCTLAKKGLDSHKVYNHDVV